MFQLLGFHTFPTETDNITQYKGSFQKIVEGIKVTLRCSRYKSRC